MATKQNKPNAELLEIKNLIGDRFNQLDRKLDENKAELKQDIARVESKLEKQITQVESKLENQITQSESRLEKQITQVESKLEKQITQVESKLEKQVIKVEGDIQTLHAEIKGVDKRLSSIENSIAKIPEITEKFGELKNWRQTAFVIIAGVVSAFLGWIARGGRI